MTGPFVVIDNAVFRKACALDPRGVLLFAPTPLEASRFDTPEAAAEAIGYTCRVRGWQVEAYQVLPLVEWEEEQTVGSRRRKKAKAPEVET